VILEFLASAYLILAPPSPALCRDFGVDVPDGTPVTGEILEYHIVHPTEIRGKCAGFASCAWPVMDNLYVIYVVDEAGLRVHEECHALYQVREHTASKP